jgi:hypothetical protein
MENKTSIFSSIVMTVSRVGSISGEIRLEKYLEASAGGVA